MKCDLIEQLHDYWFGPVEQGFPVQDRVDLWFRARPQHDWEVSRLFGPAVEAALQGQLDSLVTSPQGRLSLILLLDQLPRHLFRHTAQAYCGDEAALRHCREGMAAGQDRHLAPCQRLFFYAPLEHCEDIAVQRQAVANFAEFMAEMPEPVAQRLAYFAHWIQVHHDVIQRFGRFPWRNRALGRPSTCDEIEYLENNPPYLGQW